MESKVAIVKCSSYDEKDVRTALEQGLNLLGGIRSFINPGSKVLLKPNLLSAKPPEEGVVTHPEVVRGIARMVKEIGAHPIVGDSPASYLYNPQQVYKASGMEKMAAEEDIELAQFDEVTKINNFPISSYVNECRHIISIPKLKTHGLMTLTCAIKNLFGVVVGLYKAQCHKLAPHPKAFAKILVDVFSIAKPTLTIVDAVVAMEGDGPNTGVLRNLNLIILSNDAVACDAVVSYLTGLEPLDLLTTKEAYKRNLGEAYLEKIQVLGEDLRKLRLKDFKFPKNLEAILIDKIPNIFLRQAAKLIKWKPCVEPQACKQCEECIRICPTNAISKTKGSVKINYKECVLCLCCIEVCPYKAINLKKSLFVTLTGIGK